MDQEKVQAEDKFIFTKERKW